MKNRKKKYIGACDTYVFGAFKPSLGGKPFYKKYDLSQNGSEHLKYQGEFIDDRFICDSNESYTFKYIEKL